MSNMNKQINPIFENYKRFPITYSLILLCIVVYIFSFFLYGEEMNAYEALTLGAYNPIYVYVEHQYWRLLTSHFIHFGLLHIVLNCYSLYGLGIFIESVLKKKKYLIMLLISAISTTGLGYLLFLMNGYGIDTVSGGISGIIFGLIGGLGALALKYKNIYMDIFRELLPNVLVMLLISFIAPSISLSGHVFGLIGGFVGTLIVLYKKDDFQKTRVIH
jgi:Uncharacterized membrane protein (homolog of Drosophila rhomboid)